MHVGLNKESESGLTVFILPGMFIKRKEVIFDALENVGILNANPY